MTLVLIESILNKSIFDKTLAREIAEPSQWRTLMASQHPEKRLALVPADTIEFLDAQVGTDVLDGRIDVPTSAPRALSSSKGDELIDRFLSIRRKTRTLVSHLTFEDMTVQSMPDASPAKWHLGHTTWFFEVFILTEQGDSYQSFDPNYGYLFNSYYDALGPRHPRADRGVLTRPSVSDVSVAGKRV